MSAQGPAGPPALPETYRDCLDFLFARNQFAVKLGLDNIREFLDRLGRPQDALICLHVAGTNGKGSVCANLAALLAACGYRKVGLYTSPHLVSFRERIRVDGEPVAREWITAWMRKAMPDILDLGVTYFEIVTAMALDYFRHKGCEAVVLETGLGGRLDATNAVRPAITAVTSISLDHTHILGDTLEKIWKEKIAIMKPGVPMVVREEGPALLAELEAGARLLRSPVFTLRNYPWTVEEDGRLRFQGRYGDTFFPGALRPEEHQRENLALSLLTMEIFLDHEAKGRLPPADVLHPLLEAARVPGRTQLLTETGRLPLLLDGAHNPGGMQALSAHVKQAFPGRRILALFSVMKDKDVVSVYRSVLGFADEVLFVPLENRFPRALTLPELEEALAGDDGVVDPRAKGPAEKASSSSNTLREFPLDAAALEALLRPGAAHGADLVVVCGSLYLLGEVIPMLTPHYQGLAWFRQFEGES